MRTTLVILAACGGSPRQRIAQPTARPCNSREVVRWSEAGAAGKRHWCIDADGNPDGDFNELARDSVHGRYRHGYPIGTWVENRGTTKLREQSFDDRGLLHGASRAWSPSATLIREENFEHGVRVGRFRTWFDDGRPQVEGTYASGIPLDVPSFVDDHAPTVLAPHAPERYEANTHAFTRDRELPIGTWRSWSADGALAWSRDLDLHGLPDGQFCEEAQCVRITPARATVRWSRTDGDVQIKLRDGALDGVFEQWHWHGDPPHHQLVARRSYRHGALHGVDTEWDDDGRVASRQLYRDGVLDGPSFEIVEENAIETTVTGTYCAGHKCGSWQHAIARTRRFEETYSHAGELIAEQNFDEKGAPAGGWNRADNAYYERGELPPRVQARIHAECLAAVARGDCCEYAAAPPKGAVVCHDGPP